MAGKFESTPAERDAGLILQQEMQTAMRQRAEAQAKGDQAGVMRANADVDSITRELSKLSRSTPVRASSSSSSTVRTSSSAPAPAPPAPGMIDSVQAIFSPENALQAQQQYLMSAAKTYAGARADAAQIDTTQDQLSLDALGLTQMSAQRNLVKNKEQFSIVQQANLDPSKGDNAYFTAMDAVAINEQEYAAARAAFDQTQSIDFFSDPLGYFQAQLSLPQMASKVNQLAAKGDALEADFTRRARMSSAARETMFSDQSTQTYQLELATGAAKIREGQAAMLQAKVARGLQLTDQDLQMAGAAGGLQSASIMDAQRSAVTKAKTESEQQRSQLEDAVNRFNKYAGTQYTVDGIKQLGAAVADPILNSALSGNVPLSLYVRAAQNAGEMNRLGEYQATYGAAKGMLGKITEIRRRDPNLATAKDGLEQAQFQFLDAANKAVSGQDKQGMLTSAQDNSGNPHRIDHSLVFNGVKLAQQTGTRPPVPPTNILLQRLAAELKANQRNEDGTIPAHVEKKVLEYLVDAVSKGKYVDQVTGKKIMPSDMAKIISEYYDGAATYQQNLRKLEIVGVPRAQSYAVKMEGMDVPVDMRNPGQVEMMISRLQARRLTVPDWLSNYAAEVNKFKPSNTLSGD